MSSAAVVIGALRVKSDYLAGVRGEKYKTRYGLLNFVVVYVHY